MEVLDGYKKLHGYASATIDEVKQWDQAGGSCGEVCWQDLSLRTHRNVRTGDCVHEWNYGMGDNDFGSYHWQRAGSGGSVCFARNCDGDRSIEESPPWVPCRDVKVAVTCPMDASPGDVASVETEHGVVEVEIPEGVDGGEEFTVELQVSAGSDADEPDADSLAVQNALHAVFETLEDATTPLQGVGLPARDESKWIQDWAPKFSPVVSLTSLLLPAVQLAQQPP